MRAAAANSLVQALTWRLRGMRIRAGIFEIEQAAAVLSTQDAWTKEELRLTLLPIFCKRQEQRQLVSTLIDELLARPTPAPAQAKENVDPIEPKKRFETREPPRPEPGFWQKLQARIVRFLEIARNPKWMSRVLWLLVAVFLLTAFVVLFPGALSTLGERLAVVAMSVCGVFTDPVGSELIATNDDSKDLAFALLVRHGTVAALVASSVVAVLLIFGLRNRGETQTDPSRDKQLPPHPTKGDTSVFRVGSLGGPPPRFLTLQLATEIVELLNYRPTESDRWDLDLRATVDRRVRGDMDSLVFEKRKDLPTVVILTDGACDASYWNTIAAEFQTALERRGLVVETFVYSGSLSGINRTDPYRTGTVASALETIAEGRGWMLTTVFGDLRRLSRRDASLLVGLREQGSVLAFDYNDPRLWDSRHEMLENLGIGPHPATGPALRRALASAFAPDRAATRQAGVPQVAVAVFETLSEPHAQWASSCAMVEPVSFALAERLRGAHPELSGEGEGLAFSLLARLPGSWIGPEGLRFSAEMRRRLLSRSSATPRDQQFAFLRVLDEAFGEEPTSITAAELWRYTRAQAELFTPRQVRALQDLADIKAGGLIDERKFDDLVQRLRQPGESTEQGTMLLPQRSSRVLALAGRPDTEPEPDEKTAKEPQTVSATWSLGLAEVRVRLSADATPLVAFLPGGRNILVMELDATNPQAIFNRIDAVRGSRESLSLGEPLSRANLGASDFSEMMVFPNAQAGILATRSGRLFSFLQAEDAGNINAELLPNLSLAEVRLGTEIGGAPLLALSTVGNRIACCGQRARTLVVTEMNEGNRPQHIGLPGAITALAFSQVGAVLCGLENGDIFRVAGIDSSSSPDSSSTSKSLSSSESTERIASFGYEITALAEFVSEDSNRAATVVALSDGRIVFGDVPSLGNAELALPWRPRWLTPFPDRKAALVDDTPVGFSVAATGPNGEFDVAGFPLDDEGYQYRAESLISESVDPSRDGVAILAINAERRRVVVRNGLYLEVRPLLYDLPEPDEAKATISMQEAPPSAQGPDFNREGPGAVPA
ncbi:MAG: hypothetical protein E5X67_23415 [Mesorhizobium sp.]|uniref:hypothetical protein n=1 Tax=Mesorhizobium sp. TaxID=1871066 RepID=UPI00122085BA|nr:hypothetical protein [Mesorhizobium sp.]TIP25745.1 MAG: hypothetical protein E5X67_23415 [Mesorhizobium sp.]